MKKVFSIAAILFMTIAAFGQNPVITFNKTTHDFGKINETDGKVTTIFTFKNEGMTPLVLSNVRASCGCTTPKWTREPIEPGQTGEITVTYNPNGRPGRFQKTITITSNATEPSTKLYIKGEVIPKPAQPVDQYPEKMGALSLKRRAVNFGTIIKGHSKTVEIEYANQTDQAITVDVLIRDADSFIKPNVTLKKIEPQQTGKLQFSLQSQECPLFGPIATTIYVMVNDKREINDTYAIKLSANIKEDFSKLTVEERQKAPITEVQREINLGNITKGKKAYGSITLANAGSNPLIVRRLIANDNCIKLVEPKSHIKGGRKAEIKVEIDTNLIENPAQYSRTITLITNDPNNPIINIKLNWVVE